MCKKQLFEDEGLSDDPSVLGQECHIVGEENATKSPRGLDPMPLNQRNFFDNLILLCRDHHKIIDDQPDKYTIEELHRVKNEHIIWVRQTLGFDEAKQLDDETYLSIAQKWEVLSGLDDWRNFTYLVLAGDSPSVKSDRWPQLKTLNDWLFERVYPDRYAELNASFENFRQVLNDFIGVFSVHSEPPTCAGGDLRTRKFYRIKEWNEELYEKLGKDYDEHKSLLCNLAIELTRAGNYICDLLRTNVYRGFRVKVGQLVVETGTWSDGIDYTVRVAYKPSERIGNPYPGLERFNSVRWGRDFFHGQKNEIGDKT